MHIHGDTRKTLVSKSKFINNVARAAPIPRMGCTSFNNPNPSFVAAGAILIDGLTTKWDTGDHSKVPGTTTEIDQCRFRNNTAIPYNPGNPASTNYFGGGAICVVLSKLDVRDSEFVNNAVHGAASHAYGGAMFSIDSAVSLRNSMFNGNAATGGGAILVGDSKGNVFTSISVVATQFIGNDGKGAGGALYALRGGEINFLFNNVTFRDNAPGSFDGCLGKRLQQGMYSKNQTCR